MYAMAFGILTLFKAMASPTAEDLIQRIDQNMDFETRTAEIEMTVKKGRRTKVYKMISHGRGKTEAAISFKKPARDKGTKMLKKNDELWMYLPSIEKTQKISGHMLRKGIMGSDMSYEDMMESTKLVDNYTAVITGEENHGGSACYRMEMTARSEGNAYHKRVSLIDKESLVPRKEMLYAASGRLVKEWTMSDIKTFEGRNYPTTIVVKDRLQANSITTVKFVDLKFKVALEDEIFNKRWLER